MHPVAPPGRRSARGPTDPAGRSRPAEVLAGSAAAAEYITAACLADTTAGPVGLEVEAHCFDLSRPRRRPSWARIAAVCAALPTLPGGSAVTVEPGGAVELSSPPLDGAVASIEAMTADQAVLRSVFARAGLGLVPLGTDPLRPTRRINPGARYQAMERFFAASHTGEAGAAMMTATASVQVNIEAGPRSGWTERVRRAHALGPTMVALCANSPMLGGTFSGWVSTRQRVWSLLDSARCGPILGAEGEDPRVAWARYALKAPVMLVHTPEAVPVTSYVPFADWADGWSPLGGRRPTTADLDYHLTTLFPPVRPRGWLEIRYLDSVPAPVWPAMVFTLVTLLDDPVAADLAAAAVAPVATAWDTAARIGLADRRLYAAANRCVAVATERAPASLAPSMALLVEAVERGRCPGEVFAERVIGEGIEAAVTRLAREDG